MRKIVCFLGAKPCPSKYLWGSETVEGEVFAEVLYQKETFDQMLVFTTQTAHEKSFPVLQKYEDERIKELPIDDGKDLREIWKLFEKIIAEINEGDEVIFDITHGYRSLPFLTFLFAAYLKTAKNARIVAVYYGALEMARDRSDGLAPVLELSEFVQMLDWIIAADQFIQTSDARRLSDLLETRSEISKAAAKTLQNVSLAAFLSQPFSLAEQACFIRPNLIAAASEFTNSSLPFTVLAHQIEQKFSRLSFPGTPGDHEKLQLEYNLLESYFEHHQWSQAVTLAREWLLDALSLRLGQPLDFTHTERLKITRAVSDLVNIGQEKNGKIFLEKDLNELGHALFALPERESVAQFWADLQVLRNQIDHAQHQPTSDLIPLENMQEKIDRIQKMSKTLAQIWALGTPRVQE